MENMEVTENWYYLIVRDPGTSAEQFVGFSNDDTEKFLPVFKTKQDAKSCFALMPKEVFQGKYDVHAVIEEDILSTAGENGHQVFVIGSIMEDNTVKGYESPIAPREEWDGRIIVCDRPPLPETFC